MPRERPRDSWYDNFSAVVQLCPILILLLVPLLAPLFETDPLFVLKPNTQFSTHMKTSNLKTSYYVKPDFPQVFTGSVSKLEKTVEHEYMDMLRTSCTREKITKAKLFLKAKYSSNTQLRKKAADYSTANCDILEQLPGHGMRDLEKQIKDIYQDW